MKTNDETCGVPAGGASSGDGAAILVRPLTPADRERYVRAFAALSSETRYLRFGTPKRALSETELDRFMSPDGHHHVAFAALSTLTADIVAVARYFRDDDSAEIAVTVADGWRLQGLGSVLLNVLIAHAECDGVRVLTAETIAANRVAHSVLRSAGFERVLADGRDLVFRRSLPSSHAAGCLDRPGSTVPGDDDSNGRHAAYGGLEIRMCTATTGFGTTRHGCELSDAPPLPGSEGCGGRVRRKVALPRMAAFWLVAVMLGFVLLTSAAASPLYAVYQAQWKFSATTLTAVFAIYAIFLLVTLLLFGSVADYLGRRPVILAALAITAAACAFFLAAHGVGLLFVARALQGVAVGTATAGLGAALIDLQPEGGRLAQVVTGTSILLGLAVGALASSVLVQYGPAPTHLVWWLLLGGSLIAALAVAGLPETAPRRPGVLASLTPQLSVPTEDRGALAAAVPCLIAVWALNGLYLSLGPSLAAQVLHSPNLLWGGLLIFVLAAIEAAATVAFRAVSPPTTMLVGCLAVTVGVAVTMVAIETTSAAGLLTGAAVAGAGVGAGNLGAYRELSALAPADQRAGMIAVIFTIGYLAFSVPVVVAGLGTTQFGLHRTALVYCGSLAALSAAAAASFIIRRPPPAKVVPERTPRRP